MSDIKIEWHGKGLQMTIAGICKKAIKKTADKVERDARKLVPKSATEKWQNPGYRHDARDRKPGGLRDSITSTYWDKTGVYGAFVQAGESGREHIAGFVELGTPGTTKRSTGKGKQTRTPIKARPFLRPALKKNKRKFLLEFKGKI